MLVFPCFSAETRGWLIADIKSVTKKCRHIPVRDLVHLESGLVRCHCSLRQWLFRIRTAEGNRVYCAVTPLPACAAAADAGQGEAAQQRKRDRGCARVGSRLCAVRSSRDLGRVCAEKNQSRAPWRGRGARTRRRIVLFKSGGVLRAQSRRTSVGARRTLRCFVLARASMGIGYTARQDPAPMAAPDDGLNPFSMRSRRGARFGRAARPQNSRSSAAHR